MMTYGTVLSKRSEQMQLREISRNTQKFEKQFLCIPPYFSEFTLSPLFVQKAAVQLMQTSTAAAYYFANNAVKQYSCSH